MATVWGSQGAPVPGWMRASDEDRERVVDLLKTAFIEGLLTTDELGERVGGALAARTHADLAMVTADIPAHQAVPLPLEIEPPQVRHRPGPVGKASVVLIAATTGMLVDAALTGEDAGPMANGFYVLFIGSFLVAFATWLWALSADHEDSPANKQKENHFPERRVASTYAATIKSRQ
jgi:uncharacterized protein DUF1707